MTKQKRELGTSLEKEMAVEAVCSELLSAINSR
jgi:hypothetical protein